MAAIRFKPIYTCEGCGTEFETIDSVRIFKGVVKNGNETKIFIIEDAMYCINCIPLILDFKNECPETVKIINKLTPEEPLEPKEKPITMKDIENKFVEINKQYLKTLDAQQKKINELTEKLNYKDKLPEKTVARSEQSISRKEALKISNEILEQAEKERHEPEEIIEIEQKIEESEIQSQYEPETTTENINSETEELIEEMIPSEPFGKYIILSKINSEASENNLAKKCGCKDIKSLRETYGNKSLMGIYYSTDKYTNSLAIQSLEYRQETIEVINKIFFGVPNVVQRQAFVYPDIEIALIEKHAFDDKIEPIRYEPPVEESIENSEIVPEEKPSVNKILKSFSKQFHKSENPLKKKFSKDEMGDEYI